MKTPILTAIALAVFATASAAAAAEPATRPAATLTILHQAVGCHSWSFNGGPWHVEQSVRLREGQTLRVVNYDRKVHRLVQVSGGSLAISRGPSLLRRAPSGSAMPLPPEPGDPPTHDAAVIAAATTAEVMLWDRQGWLSRTRDASAALALEARRRIALFNVGEAIDEGVLDQRSGNAQMPSGYDACVIKDGPRGATIIERDGRRIAIPSFPIDTRSTVGSGDVFAGVLAAGIASGHDLSAAAREASAATAAVLAEGDMCAPRDLPALAHRILAQHGLTSRS